MLPFAAAHPDLAVRLARGLEEVSLVFDRQLASEIGAVNRLCVHVERYRGKMLRPTLVLLCGMAVHEDPDAEPSDAHRRIAAVVEMIHMATLVHDDVLDESELRRGGATVNRLWGNEAAVMLGDYLISNAFHLCSSIGDPALNLALGRVTNTLCEGELLQLHHRGNASLDEPTYLEIVRRKTASLIAESCRLGAQLAGADEAVAEALHRAGEALGIAFQVQDDLLDLLGEERIVGKTLGRDLAKGKLTLPVIRALDAAQAAQRTVLLDAIGDRDDAALRRVVQDLGGVDAARASAERFVADAKARLAGLPDRPVRALLLAMADAIVARDR